MKIYDLSQTIGNKTAVYPGDPAVCVTPVLRLPQDVCALTRLEFGSHTATHCDAFSHFIAGGKPVDEIPLSHFVGMALLVRLQPENGLLCAEHLRCALKHRTAEEILILSTGQEKYAGTPEYFQKIPRFDAALSPILQSAGIRTLALDCPSVESTQGTKFLHEDLLGNGIAIVEGLVGLVNLIPLTTGEPVRGFFSAAPLKIQGCDGAPTRAYFITGLIDSEKNAHTNAE